MIKLLIGIILLLSIIILLLRIQMTKYYEQKLKDMNEGNLE